MPTVQSYTEETTLRQADIVYLVKDPSGTPADRHMKWETVFKNLPATIEQVVSTTQLKLNRAIPTGSYVAIDAHTADCEIRRVSSISGNTITLSAATTNTFAVGDLVVVLPELPSHQVRMFGTSVDTAALQKAIDDAESNGGIVDVDDEAITVNSQATLNAHVRMRGRGRSAQYLCKAFPVLKAAGSDAEFLPVNFRMGGFAEDNGTTGGAGGTVTTVTDWATLKSQCEDATTRIIYVRGTLTGTSPFTIDMATNGNKTIIGVGDDAELVTGGFNLTGASNIIIRNLKINPPASAIPQILVSGGSTDVWIDHCFFLNDNNEAQLAITQANTRYVTVSWCVFRDTDTRGVMIGASAADTGEKSVTFHHCWFDGLFDRCPRIYGGSNPHVFNCLFTNAKSNCLRVHDGSDVLWERNYLFGCANPLRTVESGEVDGDFTENGSLYVQCYGDRHVGTGSATVSYSYTDIFHRVEDVPLLVKKYAGVGKIQALARGVPVRDTSGNTDDGFMVGQDQADNFSSTVPSAINSGRSAKFNNANYIACGYTFHALFASAFSVSFWLNIAARNMNTEALFSKRGSSSDGPEIFILGGGDALSFGKPAAYAWFTKVGGAEWDDGNWKHLLFTWDGGAAFSSLKCYVDGTETAQENSTGGFSAFVQNTVEPYIGATSNAGTPGNLLEAGLLDDIRFFNTNLTVAAQITALATHDTASADFPTSQFHLSCDEGPWII